MEGNVINFDGKSRNELLCDLTFYIRNTNQKHVRDKQKSQPSVIWCIRTDLSL